MSNTERELNSRIKNLEKENEELESKVYEIESLSPGNDLTLFA
jgi:hypothetical protein